MDPIYAVILAGDNEDRKIRQGRVIANKAFLPINGKNMLDYVLECYRGMSDLAGVGVIGPEEELKSVGEDVTVIPQKGDMVSNVVAAAEKFKDGWLLLSSCDIPLITPEAIRDFLSKCEGAQLYYPLVPKEDSDRVFPEMNRTWVKLKDGVYTGGNVLMVRTDKVPTIAGPAGTFFDARKSPLQMANLIGFMTLIKLMMHKLSIREVENKMVSILGVPCKAIISTYPELGTDVDKEADYNLISAKMQMAK
jgi:molybdopterin-guanine dinucleotide biosynthesis protein A